MSSIRFRPDQDLVVAGGTAPAEAGGYASGVENTLLDPGTANVQSLKIAPTTQTETIQGALRETLAARILRGIEYNDIPSEDGFDVTTALGERSAQYNSDELEFLGDSRSNTELVQRMGQVTQTRENYSDMAANPLTGMAASLFDVDAVIGLGLGKAASLSRTTRLLAGLTANSAALGLASEGGTVTPLEIIATSVGAALGAVPKARVRVPANVETRIDAMGNKTIIETDGALPPRPVPTETADTLAQTDSTIQVGNKIETVPDPDYVAPNVDVKIGTPYVEVGASKGGSTVTTNTRNLTSAILAHGDDLPDGVKVLGRALEESLALDSGSPAILRNKTASSRSNVRLNTDGTLRTTVYSKGGVQDTLTNTVKAMSTYEKTIALHEAAHAKTMRTFAAFKAGTLPDGPAKDAVLAISGLRQQAMAAFNAADQSGLSKGAKYNIKYGLQNNDEFISQLFNSEDFRKALQATPAVGGGNMFTELVHKVVQAFTGKAPVGSLFDQTVAEFEKLLQFKSDLKVGSADAPRVPSMQSVQLAEAPDIKDLSMRAGKSMNSNFALYDKIKNLGGAESAKLADDLVVDAAGSTAQSAAHYARTAHLAGTVGIAQVDTAFAGAMRARGWSVFSRFRNPTKYLEARRQLSDEVYAKLADNHAKFREGGDITPHTDPNVERIVKSYADSNWAKDQLQRIKAAGLPGSELVEDSPYYLPRRHSGDKVSDFLRQNLNVTRDDVAGMYGSQFFRMFSEQGMEMATAKKLGNQMLRNMEQRSAGVSGYRQHIAGMSDDDIEFAMRNAGIEEEQIQSFLNSAQAASKDANTVRNLRRRAQFDMTAEYTTKSGARIYPQLFVQKDVVGLMEGYTRTMSGRIGLAKAGYPDVKAIAAAVDDAVKTADDARVAKTTLDDTVNKLLGYPTGEDVPDILRSFSVLSGATALANSGVYQLADTALLMKEFGIAKVLRGMASTAYGRDALKLAQSAEYGSRLRDVLEARNVLSGRYRSVLTHLDDNTDIGSLGIAHQMIQQMGQGTRFVNGMEFVRRGQSKLTAGLIGDSIDSAIRGDAKAAESLSRFGLNQELLDKAKAAFANSEDLREWPSSIRLDMETVAHNMADTLVLENRLGEIPAWMQFSALGKFILPYMNFVAGSWNKILRRTIRQDGATGVAQMLAYQLPLTMLTSVVALSGTDKEITPGSLAANVLTQAPLMSWLGFAVNMVSQGPSNSIAALGIVDKAFSATSSILSGDPDPAQIMRAVPFMSILPGIRIMAASMDEE